MKKTKNNSLLLGKYLLLALCISHFVSISLFYHTHIVHWGTITHSHPFNNPITGEPVNSHSHSTEEYVLIQHLCVTSIADAVLNIPVIPCRTSGFELFFPAQYTRIFFPAIPSRESPRAPPV